MQWWELDELYREQLLREVRPPIAGHVIPWQVRAQLVWMEYARGKELAVEEVDRTWIWSDPHFDHEGIIEHGGRPHPDATAMTSMLCAAWRARVGTDDTIVCLGDVTIGQPKRSTLVRMGALPGRKVLVTGNHDFMPGQEWPKSYGFDEVVPTLVCNTKPKLLMTHEPLETVPPGCWSVHGHIHGLGEERSDRHVNVNVERTAYEPARLSDLLEQVQWRERHGRGR